MEPESTQPDRPNIERYLASIESLVEAIIQHGGFNLAFGIRHAARPPADLESPEYVLEFSGPDSDLLLEHNGELLDALQYVVLKAVRVEEDFFGKITFDCEDWRRLRLEELKLTAMMAAERAIQTGQPFPLNPMTARERRIVHLALKDQASVSTVSEGAGSERKVVIVPAPPAARAARR